MTTARGARYGRVGVALYPPDKPCCYRCQRCHQCRGCYRCRRCHQCRGCCCCCRRRRSGGCGGSGGGCRVGVRVCCRGRILGRCCCCVWRPRPCGGLRRCRRRCCCRGGGSLHQAGRAESCALEACALEALPGSPARPAAAMHCDRCGSQLHSLRPWSCPSMSLLASRPLEESRGWA